MGFRLLFKKGKLVYDEKKAIADLNQYTKDFVIAGGIKWLDATVKAIIPTWSKASRATFQKLAKDLGTSIPYGPLRSAKDRENLGLQNSQGSGLTSNDKGEHYFIYTTQLRYLIYNEFNKATAGSPPQPFSNSVRFTPYRFQDQGNVTWLDHAKAYNPPNTWSYLR